MGLSFFNKLSLSGGAKVYKAAITQSGTANPTANILDNSIGDVVWTRVETGNYIGTLSGAFPPSSTLAIISAYENKGLSIAAKTNLIQIYTYNDSGAAADGVLQGVSILIEVYP
jgi:hypothetical protein